MKPRPSCLSICKVLIFYIEFLSFLSSEPLHPNVKKNLVVTVTDWMWFPWLRHLGLVAMVGSCVLMWFVTIAIV